VLLCYDGPDYGEDDEEVILKAARVSIGDLATLLQTIETLVGILSEHVGEHAQVLSQQPPAMLEHWFGDLPATFHLAAPKVVRANKRKGFAAGWAEEVCVQEENRVCEESERRWCKLSMNLISD
jgi:hypothetical protein